MLYVSLKILALPTLIPDSKDPIEKLTVTTTGPSVAARGLPPCHIYFEATTALANIVSFSTLLARLC